jgi:hypothetical protein
MLSATADAGCCCGSCFPAAAGRGSEASNVISKFTPATSKVRPKDHSSTLHPAHTHKPDVGSQDRTEGADRRLMCLSDV